MSGLLGAVLRGIRARGLLSAGSVLLTALAVGSAVLGPVFQIAVTRSYVVTRVNEAPPDQTGLSRTFEPGEAFEGGVAEAEEAVASYALATDEGPFDDPTFQVLSDRVEGGLHDPDGRPGEVNLLAAEGACDHLVISGRCPTSPGEALILAGDLEHAGTAPRVEGGPAGPLRIGDRIDLGPDLPSVTLVGSYRVEPDELDYWFDLDRLASTPRHLPEPPETHPLIPYRPAPLIVPVEAFDAISPQRWSVLADRRIDVPPDWTEADLAAASSSAAAVAEEDGVEVDGGTVSGDPLLDLEAILAEVRSQEDTARASIAPAVLSLVLVALALLMRLLMAASELRLPELALASLRGVGERRLWWLGLIEPLLLLLVAIPIGVVTGLVLAWGLIRWWLVPGLPVPTPAAAWLAALLVALAAVGVAVAAVGVVLRTSLATQLTGLRRPRSSSRAAVVAQLVLVAAAVAILVTKLTADGAGEPDVTDMVLPVVLAVVAGLAATRLVSLLARWRSRRTSASLAGFVAARALGRRSESTLVILPITAAIAVSVFAFGVQDSAAAWRASVAATTSPASQLWRSPMTMAQTVDATHAIDPEGSALMALARFQVPTARLSVVDAPRLAAVGEWPAEWTPGRTVETVQEQIRSHGDPPVLTGTRIGLTLTNDLDADDDLVVLMETRTAAGETMPVFVGPFPAGTSTVLREAPECRAGCAIESLVLGAGAGQRMRMQGRVRILALTSDGSVEGTLSSAGWGESLGVGLPDVSTVSLEDDVVLVDIDTEGASGLARLAPGQIPLSRPVLQGTGDHSEVTTDSEGRPALEISGAMLPVDVVGEAESMPLTGPAGTLIDYRMLASDRTLFDQNFTPYVGVAEGAPSSVTAQLADRGFIRETTLEAEQRLLDQGAYALALRLYGVVSVLVLLMALAGLVVSTAVQLPARRRDAAALRVVGVPRRSVISAVARELLTVLGAAAVAGIAAGSLAQYVVLRTVQLGYVEDLVTPRLVATIDLGQVALVALMAVAVFGVFAFVNAVLVVRGARGATLRETAR